MVHIGQLYTYVTKHIETFNKASWIVAQKFLRDLMINSLCHMFLEDSQADVFKPLPVCLNHLLSLLV